MKTKHKILHQTSTCDGIVSNGKSTRTYIYVYTKPKLMNRNKSIKFQHTDNWTLNFNQLVKLKTNIARSFSLLTLTELSTKCYSVKKISRWKILKITKWILCVVKVNQIFVYGQEKNRWKIKYNIKIILFFFS